MQALAAEQPKCWTAEEIAAYLGRYGETMRYEQPIAGTPLRWQFWAPEAGNSWTVVLSKGDAACVMTDGGQPVPVVDPNAGDLL